MEPISVDHVRAQLEKLRGQWRRVSLESGVPYKTIKNFMQGVAEYPRVPTLNKLTEYLKQRQQ